MNNYEVFDLLNLDCIGMEEIKKSVEEKNYVKGLSFLKEYFLNRVNPILFVKDSEKKDLVNYAVDNFKEDVEDVIKVAEELSNNVFVFRFPWDMEKTNIPVKFKDGIEWDYIPNADPEWSFMLNRHRYFVALGQAYLITGNETYAKTFVSQLEDWIDNNPNNSKTQKYSWRTIDTGLRCDNWLRTYEYFKDSEYFTDELFAKFLMSIHEQCEYIYGINDGFRKISNWGVLENRGLYETSLYIPEFKKSEEWKNASIKRLKDAAKLQVMEDGVHWEQSSMYHNEVLHCFLDSIIVSQRNNIIFDEDVIRIAKKMAYVDLYMSKPNRHQPLLGDSDDVSVMDVLTTASYVFKDGTLKFGAYSKLDYNNIWLFGLDAIKEYGKLRSIEPKETSIELESSGNYIMRSGWDKDDLYMFFDCGFIGGGHGHADMLHLDMHAYGRDLLVDSGRYTYIEGSEWRKYFKECSGHNVVLVDGVDFVECVGSWQIGHLGDACAQKWISTEAVDYVEGSHTGYDFLEDSVRHTRKVLFVKPNYWILIDSFKAKKEHEYKQLFHFAPGEVLIEKNNQCRTDFEEDGNMRIIPFDNERLQCRVLNSYVSPEYNTMVENKVVEYSWKAEGCNSLISMLYPQKQGDTSCPNIEKIDVFTFVGELVDDKIAEAYKITFAEDKTEHIILVCYKQPAMHINCYVVDGTQVFGEIVLIKRKGNSEEIIRVK